MVGHTIKTDTGKFRVIAEFLDKEIIGGMNRMCIIRTFYICITVGTRKKACIVDPGDITEII